MTTNQQNIEIGPLCVGSDQPHGCHLSPTCASGPFSSVRVLVACEESQAVTIAMRKRGVRAFSCDLCECSGGHPEWHIQGNVTPLLREPWDMVIAFPPCTHLASSGARWFEEKRADGRQQAAIDFFMQFTRLSCPWAIENPVGIMSTEYRKPDQIIQPWMFGHGEQKATCLWLHGLPKLKPTNIVDGREQRIWRMGPSEDRATLRSKTYHGIAEAMADQWLSQTRARGLFSWGSGVMR